MGKYWGYSEIVNYDRIYNYQLENYWKNYWNTPGLNKK